MRQRREPGEYCARLCRRPSGAKLEYAAGMEQLEQRPVFGRPRPDLQRELSEACAASPFTLNSLAKSAQSAQRHLREQIALAGEMFVERRWAVFDPVRNGPDRHGVPALGGSDGDRGIQYLGPLTRLSLGLQIALGATILAFAASREDRTAIALGVSAVSGLAALRLVGMVINGANDPMQWSSRSRSDRLWRPLRSAMLHR